MKNGNNMDIKVVTQQKQTGLKPLRHQLTYAIDMPYEPQENITIKHRPAQNPRLESIQPSISRILVVDDSDESRDILEIFLGQSGYDVVSTNNGHEAWYLFQKENFDLVLTDICMPGLNGNELANHIKSQRKALPIIAITGSSWLAEGCFDEVMTKPVWLHALLDTINFQLTKASALSGIDAEHRQ